MAKPKRVYKNPFIISPPPGFLDGNHNLRRAANNLAHVYANKEGTFITDDGLQAMGTALWTALVAADADLPQRFNAARVAAGTRILPVIVESAEAAVHAPLGGALPPRPRLSGPLGLVRPVPAGGRFARLRRRQSAKRPAAPAHVHLPARRSGRREERLDVELQQALALQAWGEAIAEGRVQLKMPDDGRFSTFQRLIDTYDPHVVFFFTHGSFHRPLKHEREEPYATLLFEAEDGTVIRCEQTLLRRRWRPGRYAVRRPDRLPDGHDQLRELMAGMIWQLNRAGVPHVIGMRESILADAGIQFNHALGEAMVDGQRFDVAIQRAREAIAAPLAGKEGIDAALAEQSLGQWALPALISHTVDLPLIDWQFAPEPPTEAITRDNLLGTVSLPPRFIGRRSELRRYKGPLLRGERPALLITGPGGQGKTSLAGKIAADWAGKSGELFVWSAREESGVPWEQLLLQLELALAGLLREQYTQKVESLASETERMALLLGLLLDQHGGDLLIFLDDLESLQDGESLALADEGVAAFIQAGRSLGGDGLRLLLTSRWRWPGWPDDTGHLPLTGSSYGDFVQMAFSERAGAAFWQPDRPRRISTPSAATGAACTRSPPPPRCWARRTKTSFWRNWSRPVPTCAKIWPSTGSSAI